VNNLIKILYLSSFLFAELPASKEVKLIEQVSSSECILESTGKYISSKKISFRARKDVDKNGVIQSINDAKKAMLHYLLFGGTDPLISDVDKNEKFQKYQSGYFEIDNINKYISWEEDGFQKKIKINDGKGLKIVKRFKFNQAMLIKDLENDSILEPINYLSNVLGNPSIMVVPITKKDEDPIELLKTNKMVKHAASVLESYLTSKQYNVVVPSAIKNIDYQNSGQMFLGYRDDDFAYQLALSIGSDIYLTYKGTVESSGYETEKYSVIVSAYETSTGKLLGSETGYSKSRKGEVMISIEEAINDAMINVLSRVSNYWELEIEYGIQYKLIFSLSTDFNEDEIEAISFLIMDAVEQISNKSKENISTPQTIDYIIWCNPKDYDKPSKIYRYFKKKFQDLVKDENIDARLRKININRKSILLKIDSK
tara:strand:+ start:703 stop:1980 length:1278 start_codon:yes stop_codon:yes gene_type:complete